MRNASAVLLALLMFLLAMGRAEAQVVEIPDEGSLDYSLANADARYVANVGMGLTITGISSLAFGTSLAFGAGWPGFFAGIAFWSIGGLFTLIGLPTWIAGGVRTAITNHRWGEARRAEAHRWRDAGIGTFVASLIVATIGGALLGAGIALVGTPYQGLAVPGVAMLPLGFWVAAFVGAPMWAEGARF